MGEIYMDMLFIHGTHLSSSMKQIYSAYVTASLYIYSHRRTVLISLLVSQVETDG